MKFLIEKAFQRLSVFLESSKWGGTYLEGLNGSIIELNISDLGLVYKVSLTDGVFSFPDVGEQSTLVIRGDLEDLIRLIYYARKGQSFPAGCVEISGDLSVMHVLQDLIHTVGDGFEEFLIGAIGPIGAHKLIRAYEKAVCASEKNGVQFAEHFKEYLIFEKKMLPSEMDLSNLEKEIFELIGAVDSVESRLNRILKDNERND